MSAHISTSNSCDRAGVLYGNLEERVLARDQEPARPFTAWRRLVSPSTRSSERRSAFTLLTPTFPITSASTTVIRISSTTTIVY